MLSRFHPIPERYGQTDIILLYQYHASVCSRAIKIVYFDKIWYTTSDIEIDGSHVIKN